MSPQKQRRREPGEAHRDAADEQGKGSTRRQIVAAAVVSDLTSWEILGLTARQYRQWLVDHQVPHETWRRHVFARVDHVLAALDRASGAGSASSLTEDDVVRLAARGSR